MTGFNVDDALRELSAELARATPSSGFRAGVRARVGETRAAAWRKWTWAATAAAILATAGVVVLRWNAPETTAVRPSNSSAQVAAVSARPVAADAVTSTPHVRSDRRASPPARRSASATSRVPATVAGPDLTVVTNQPELLRRLWSGVPQPAAIAAGATGRPAEDPLTPLEVPLLTVDLITVPPVGDVATSGAAPRIRRLATVDATRSN